MSDKLDVVIIGGGPAGLTAALYASRALLSVRILERLMTGGQMILTDLIENYPGFPEGIQGPKLSELMHRQSQHFGTQFKTTEVLGVRLEGNWKILETAEGEIAAKALIIATGADPKTLGIPGEEEFRGRGVSYCATCDGAFFQGVPVVVVGGGDTAVEEGIFLTKYASTVTIIHRRDALRAEKIIQDRAFKNPKINFLWDAAAVEVLGTQQATGLRVRNLKTKEERELAAEGVFIFVGQRPNTDFLKGLVATDQAGFIQTDQFMKTNIAGIFAVGDVRQTPLRQIATAVGDGAIAAVYAEKYIESINW
jgi:thioredoxin reductase (NADPH)